MLATIFPIIVVSTVYLPKGFSYQCIETSMICVLRNEIHFSFYVLEKSLKKKISGEKPVSPGTVSALCPEQFDIYNTCTFEL